MFRLIVISVVLAESLATVEAFDHVALLLTHYLVLLLAVVVHRCLLEAHGVRARDHPSILAVLVCSFI